MANAKDPKPVNLLCIEACKVDGNHLAKGEVLMNVPYDLATDLTGAGRTRLATDEDIAAAKKAKKAE